MLSPEPEPPAGGLGQADRGRPGRHGDPGPLPAPRGNHHDQGLQLPAEGPSRRSDRPSQQNSK